MKVNMHEAKSQLSKLGELVWQGKKVVIAKAGKPYLDLKPHHPQQSVRVPGMFKGQITMAADFDETPPEVLQQFEG